jgi:hypothetical protein
MPVGFVILAFFLGAFLGSLTMALACAAHDREESFELMRDDALSVPLPTADTSKWN